MKMVSARSFTALFFFALSSSVQAAPELVMPKGSSIVASMGGDTVKIVAGYGFDRSYEFDGCTLNSKMHARSGRWFGALGIYDPAGPSFFRRECKGISRTVVEEAQIHFDVLYRAASPGITRSGGWRDQSDAWAFGAGTPGMYAGRQGCRRPNSPGAGRGVEKISRCWLSGHVLGKE